MTARFWRYICNLYDDIPEKMYLVFLTVFCLGSILFFLLYGTKRGWKMLSRLLLAEYVVIIYSVTVFFREELVAQKYRLTPFWSYRVFIEEGRKYMFIGNIMNILVFIPVGVLLGMSFDKIKAKIVFFAGLIISLSIEIMQYVTVRGLAEIDDLMHNTIGCMLGFGVYYIIKRIYDGITKRVFAVL